ncbi:MAG TPA: hypothetical protein VMO26_21965 [Vicinamibacterales bacterium]|nr:hypothetical protein [Vicinamibacterales bacterium]
MLFVTIAAGWLAWLLTLPPRPSPWLVFLSGLPLLALTSWLSHRGRPESWPVFIRRTGDVHFLAVVLLGAFGVQFADAHGVTTDGVIYFSQLRSVLFDGDLDLAAEFAFLQQPPRPYHVVPIGPTFVWFPLYVCVAVVDTAGRSLGLWTAPAAAVGLTLPYVRAALVSSFAIGGVGLITLHRRLSREFSPGVACSATLLVFLATPLVWYMVYEPSMTHAASFGFVAIFVVAAEKWTAVDMSVRRSLALGGLLGLAFMTRPQEAVFAIFPAMVLLCAAAPLGARLRASARLAGWAFVGALPFLALQAVHSTILFGREEFVLVGGAGYLDFFRSRWADTLWSSWHGFFSWTPVAYLAFVAMFGYVLRNRAWAIAAIVIVLAMAWVNGSTADWAAGWAFGGRRFISVLVVLAPGMALIVWGLTRRPMIALAIIAVGAMTWNHLLTRQYHAGLLTSGAPVSFAQMVRQQAALATAPPFVYPFAFPANVWFAWRTGLRVDQYDLLGPESLRTSLDLPMSADASRYLTEGWGAHVSDPFGELRWIDGDRAELLLPLDLPVDRPIRVAWTSRTRQLHPPEPATFALVINGRETFRFTPDTDQATFFEFTVPAGSDLWVRGFNRVTFDRAAGSAPLAVYRIAVTAELKTKN